MQDGSEHFPGQLIRARQFEDMRRNVIALRRRANEVRTRLFQHPRNMSLEPLLCLGIDHGPNMRGRVARVADSEFACRARYHLDHAIGDVVLNEQQP